MKIIVVLLAFIITISAFGQSSQDDQDKKWRQDMTNRIAADIAGVAAILSRTAPAVEPQAEAPVGP